MYIYAQKALSLTQRAGLNGQKRIMSTGHKKDTLQSFTGQVRDMRLRIRGSRRGDVTILNVPLKMLRGLHNNNAEHITSHQSHHQHH